MGGGPKYLLWFRSPTPSCTAGTWRRPPVKTPRSTTGSSARCWPAPMPRSLTTSANPPGPGQSSRNRFSLTPTFPPEKDLSRSLAGRLNSGDRPLTRGHPENGCTGSRNGCRGVLQESLRLQLRACGSPPLGNCNLRLPAGPSQSVNMICRHEHVKCPALEPRLSEL